MNPSVIYSVKEFNELINVVLQESIGEVTITGEVTGYQVRQNKWVSFDLKDKESILNCFTSLYQLDFPLEDGMEVMVTGTARIYVPYGKFSFNVRRVEIKGEGALKKAFEELKTKLTTEGLFDSVHKRPLPRFPESIGIITSGDGAAINDIRKVINQRWGGLKLYLIPVLVQGKNAPDELMQALHYFNEYHPVDVIIFGRGGGSLEDLQAFNSERVARAIFSSRIPIVAGIGHEHNTSIADLVADVRAATPSNAAELAVPDRQAVLSEIHLSEQRLRSRVEQKLAKERQNVSQATQTLRLFITSRLGEIRLLSQKLLQQFRRRREGIAISRQNVTGNQKKLSLHVVHIYESQRKALAATKQLLAALNPTAVLARGYSITYNATTLSPIKRLADLPPDGKIRTQIGDGVFESTTTTQLVVAPPTKPKTNPTAPLSPDAQSSLF